MEVGHEMELQQLVYTSLMKTKNTALAADIDEIIESSQSKNEESAISGCLMISGQRVVQFLEGPTSAVSELYQKISVDQRHEEVIELYRGRSAKREAGEWPMALCNLQQETTETKELQEFFNTSLSTFKFHADGFRMLMRNYLFENRH